jgi:hypothetical protein
MVFPFILPVSDKNISGRPAALSFQEIRLRLRPHLPNCLWRRAVCDMIKANGVMKMYMPRLNLESFSVFEMPAD